METPREQSRGVSISIVFAKSLRAEGPLVFLRGLPSFLDRREIPRRRFVRGACGNAGTWNTWSLDHARISNPVTVLLPREPA